MVVLKVSAQTKGRKSYAATNICSNFGGKWDKKTALADLVPKQLLFCGDLLSSTITKSKKDSVVDPTWVQSIAIRCDTCMW